VENTNKILLNSVKLPNNVNTTTQFQFALENKNKPLPLNDIDTTVSQYEQFLKERKDSSIYRFYGVVKPVISNPLFNENVKIYFGENNDIKTKDILSSNIFEKDGWVGFYNDEPDEDALQFNDNESALCNFSPFDPGYDRLRMLDSDGKQNYLLKILYPFNNKDITLVKNNNGISLKDGIPIIDQFGVELNGIQYVGFRTPMNHGLSDGDRVKLINFQDLTVPNTLKLNEQFYRVYRTGNQTNSDKLRTFIVEINSSDISFTVGVSTIKRVVRDKESQYYVRQFKSLTFDYQNYDFYPAAYGVTSYNDDVAAFNFKTDIDVSDIVDNLGRPITELYLGIIKNDNDSDPTTPNSQYWINSVSGLSSTLNTRFWTPISAGYDLENNTEVNYNIRSFGDETYVPSTYFLNIDESDEIFDGDIVEYNENELLERPLENVYHRVNTIYREYLNSIKPELDNKKEGYIYSPFNLIKIREFRNTINPIVDIQSKIDEFNITNPQDIENLIKAYGVPNYARLGNVVNGITTGNQISNNIYKWRDLMDIGETDVTGSGVDYPFESGAHYIYLDKRFYFQRQDPPCEYRIISELLVLGASDTNNQNKNKFIELLKSPTYLKYSINIPTINLDSFDEQPSFINPLLDGQIIYNANAGTDASILQQVFNNVFNTSINDTTGYYRWDSSVSAWEPVVFTLGSGASNVVDVLNYNGAANLNVEVTLVDFEGEYELGKRDVAGGCVDLSLLNQNQIDDEC
jgi:hypothetical protein